MKRRDFIVNSALCVWAAALFSGCNKNDIKNLINKLLKEDYKKAVRLSENIIDEFKKYNIDYITLDLEGLRNGSMDI